MNSVETEGVYQPPEGVRCPNCDSYDVKVEEYSFISQTYLFDVRKCRGCSTKWSRRWNPVLRTCQVKPVR
jgi:hypothetical protein